jgi:hypothetical protein
MGNEIAEEVAKQMDDHMAELLKPVTKPPHFTRKMITALFRVAISPFMAAIWVSLLMSIAAIVVLAGVSVAALFVGIGLVVGALLVVVGAAIGAMSMAFAPVAVMRFALGYQTLMPIVEELREKAKN